MIDHGTIHLYSIVNKLYTSKKNRKLLRDYITNCNLMWLTILLDYLLLNCIALALVYSNVSIVRFCLLAKTITFTSHLTLHDILYYAKSLGHKDKQTSKQAICLTQANIRTHFKWFVI